MRIYQISYYVDRDFDLGCRRTLHSTEEDAPAEHKHYFYELVVVCSGTGIHRTAGHDYELSPGNVFLIPPFQKHSYPKYNNLEIFNLMFSRYFLRFLQADLTSLPGYQLLFKADPSKLAERPSDGVRLEMEAFPEIISILSEMDKINGSNLQSILLSDFLRVMYLIAKHSRWSSDRGSNQHIEQLTTVLSALEGKCTANWSLERMARLARMSLSGFGHEFQKFTGTSPIQYLLDLRLERAVFLLETTDLPLERIAMDCGFTDRSYFSRQFLKKFQTRPSLYRKELPQRLQDAHREKGF